MTIQVFQPSTDHREFAAVASTLDSHWLGRGSIAAAFERAWAEHIGVRPEKCLAITSATEGLFTIFQMILSPGDEVIIPSIHFHGVANAVLAAGGKPVFCDVDRRTLNTDHRMIWKRITPKTKAVCVLHYGGYPCDIDRIEDLCHEHQVYLIEDSANSPASSYKGKACGTWGDFGIWSFDAMKVMTTGDGGMLYSKTGSAIQTARKMMYLGLDEQSGLSSKRDQWWTFDVEYPGRRSLMNDLTASIGIEQLKKLPGFVGVRTELTRCYDERLWNVRQVYLPAALYFDGGVSSCYFYWISLPNQETRDGLARFLRDQDVYVTMRYAPLHRIPLYEHDGYPLPNAEYAADRTLLLPLHANLTFDDVETVCRLVKEYFER